ncbi:MAG: alpha-galactosidase [Microbacterium sp.]
MTLIHFRANTTSLVLSTEQDRLPGVVYWGADLGELTADDLAGLAAASVIDATENTYWDASPATPVIPFPSDAWMVRPGLLVARQDGSSASPRFASVAHEVTSEDGAWQLQSAGIDDAFGVEIAVTIRLEREGLIRAKASVRNLAASALVVQELALTLPVPAGADEIFGLHGRHLHESAPQRAPFSVGAHVRESWEGRPGHSATLWLCAGRSGFGYRSGTVHGLHVAFSGGHRVVAERDTVGRRMLRGGELLEPGEIALAQADLYESPWIVGSWGEGLDELAGRAHDWLRGRSLLGPRPVLVNTWEASYFDHDPDALIAFAERAAEVGAERFVLDDGWFRGRRDDRAGLGDWFVDEGVWPDGLHPLVERVRSLGMEFGLWVEPEMVNIDSDLAREHPDWILDDGSGAALEQRHQRVLDLARDDVFSFLLERLDALVGEYRIDYLKWDHNSPVVGQRHSADGRPVVHEQTLAAYRLMDELRHRHPSLEIESCASGGGRIDLEIATRTDRFWASDCIDPHEAARIFEGTTLLVPPERVGMHIGAERSHTTGRTTSLAFRAAIAFWGHLGIEAGLASLSEEEFAELRAWVALHREHRDLLHAGRVVRADPLPDDARIVSGVVAHDGAAGLFLIASRGMNAHWGAGPLPLPGLEANAHYRVELLRATSDAARTAPWMREGVTLSGAILTRRGLTVHPLRPESALIVCVTRQGDQS